MKNKLNEISEAKYYNKPVTVVCVVSGKSIAPYYVPKIVNIKCGKLCKEGCRFNVDKGIDVLIKPEGDDILQFIDLATSKYETRLRQMFNITCRTYTYEIKEMQNIERIFISQPTGGARDKWGSARVAYYVGHGIDINTIYKMKGYSINDPANQTATHIFSSVKKIKSDIESFALSPSMHQTLSKFKLKPRDSADVFIYLEKLYRNYAHNITKIYGEKRFLLHMAVDLAFHSVLSFNFDGEYIHKGWVDSMIVGDPRCGKGFVAERLTKHYGVGEVISADNCSFAGLVAGLQQYSGHWVITWGKIPMNDCGLVTIDEASEIQENVWSRLSRIRSEGIAEITKIQTQTTNARTRTIFIANPPFKTISNYSYGIQSLLDIVKTPEDIARFDYVCVVSHDEVPMESINESKDEEEILYAQGDERDLIMWIWSRQASDIEFTKQAIDLVYQRSIKLSTTYDFSIPLIQGENIRVKIAKLAICFAGRLYSNKNDGKILLVNHIHVECAVLFLTLLYKTEANGYYVYSQIFKSTGKETVDKQLKAIDRFLSTFRFKTDICKCLLMTNNITLIELMEYLNQERGPTNDMLSRFIRHGCLIKKRNYYVKSAFFTSYLKDIVVKD